MAAAASPAKSISTAAESPGGSGAASYSSNASKNLRGLNKPKCIKCGNVARSRCPYQSCKSCCAKAQNPCHIHVLKGNSSLPDKLPTAGSPLLDPQSTESHSGSSQRLRQLSSNFAQFSNLQAPFRSRKPLTRKDAQVINEWRFRKLKEFKDRNIDSENEAFDRYMQNASLLREMFFVNSDYADELPEIEPNSEETTERMVNGLKLKLKSNPARMDNFRKRIRYIVDQGIRKLRKFEFNESSGELGDRELETTPNEIKSFQDERTAASSDLIEKMNQARNEDDVKTCHELASEIFGPSSQLQRVDDSLISIDHSGTSVSTNEHHLYPFSKWVSTISIDQDSLSQIDAQFSALLEIENL